MERVYVDGKEREQPGHLEESVAKTEGRLNMASRLDTARAVCDSA